MFFTLTFNIGLSWNSILNLFFLLTIFFFLHVIVIFYLDSVYLLLLFVYDVIKLNFFKGSIKVYN